MLCAPGTMAVLLFHLYHSTIASKTLSVILRVILTAVTLGCLPLQITSWEIFMFKGPADSPPQADEIGKPTITVYESMVVQI